MMARKIGNNIGLKSLYIFFLFSFLWHLCLGSNTSQAESFHIDQKYFNDYSFTKVELNHHKNKVKEFFNFALDNYLEEGYPYDEIRPISCVPKTRNFDDLNDLVTNDVLGNFTTTLIDSLTTVAVIGDRQRMKELVDLVLNTFDDFAIDSTVQVFETTIRIIGSLISTHLYITDNRKKVYLGDDYDGKSLLNLATDMADRLLPAFMTKTGLPVPRINLLTKFKELTADFVNENNAAGMSSPMFEFTLLSYLTNDMKYEKISRYAFDKVWSIRTALDLVPVSFNPQYRNSYSSMTGIGASIDSFFEYALKGSVLFDDVDLYDIWNTAYDSLNVNCRGDWFYYNVDSNTGQLFTNWVDSLSGFFPGLQVLVGDLNDAVPKHIFFMKLWNTFGGIPERWSFEITKLFSGKRIPTRPPRDQVSEEWLRMHNIPLEWYPLRPEFVESTYFLYRATKDPFYLNVGVRILHDLEDRFKGPCGFAGMQNLYTGEIQDRMESFVLSETLKYLYLLFDEDNEIHYNRDNIVFSTEGHPMWLRPEVKNNYKMNGTFSDKKWIKHLEMCEIEEIAYLEKLNKKDKDKDKDEGNRLVNFAKKLISRTKDIEEEIEIEEEIDIVNVVHDNDYDYDKDKDKYNNLQCVKYETSNGYSLLYSEILSGYDKLFEVDSIYNDTLDKPLVLQNYEAMELESKFYNRWADPKRSQSKRDSTTDTLEIIFYSMNGTYVSPKLYHNNATMYCETFQGRRKLRLEKIQPNTIDAYGKTVTTQEFELVDRRDIFRRNCDQVNELYTPATLYRAVKLDGYTIPDGYTVQLPRDELFPEQRDENTSLGLNSEGRLMLECIPIVNIYVL